MKRHLFLTAGALYEATAAWPTRPCRTGRVAVQALAKKHGVAVVDDAAKAAIDIGVLKYRFVRKIRFQRKKGVSFANSESSLWRRLRKSAAAGRSLASSPSLKCAISWIGGIDSDRPTGRDIQIGHPDLHGLGRQVSCEVDMALAAVDKCLAGTK